MGLRIGEMLPTCRCGKAEGTEKGAFCLEDDSVFMMTELKLIDVVSSSGLRKSTTRIRHLVLGLAFSSVRADLAHLASIGRPLESVFFLLLEQSEEIWERERLSKLITKRQE
jgi:hypothetical protein